MAAECKDYTDRTAPARSYNPVVIAYGRCRRFSVFLLLLGDVCVLYPCAEEQ